MGDEAWATAAIWALSSYLGGELNRSMQHLASNIGEEDVAYEEISAKKTLL